MRRTLTWVTIYAVAMGILEGAVVVYLRRLYFPAGFRFPMRSVETDIMIVELWREIATMAMLLSVGMIAGRNRSERFAYFIYTFGLWDLVYYGFLKYSLGWPESLFTWDILFLMPVPWVGPVLAPCLVAATMCGIAVTAIWATERGLDARMTNRERGLLILGALIIILACTIEWTQTKGPTLWMNLTQSRDLLYGLGDYVPQVYPWWIFLIGEALGLVSWYRYARRLKQITVPVPN